MGLDMFLFRAPRYKNVTAQEMAIIDNYMYFTHRETATIEEYLSRYNNPPVLSKEAIALSRQVEDELLQEVAYWRKANQIHNFFVEKTQDGIDECQYSEVSKEILSELWENCKHILDNCKQKQNGTITNPYIAQETLPTQSGFFFGSTDYDEYYLSDITRTIETLEKIAYETNFEKEMIIYHASW